MVYPAKSLVALGLINALHQRLHKPDRSVQCRAIDLFRHIIRAATQSRPTLGIQPNNR